MGIQFLNFNQLYNFLNDVLQDESTPLMCLQAQLFAMVECKDAHLPKYQCTHIDLTVDDQCSKSIDLFSLNLLSPFILYSFFFLL